MRKTLYPLGAAFWCAGVILLCQTAATEELFLVKPYLQLGDAPALAKHESLILLWHTSGKTAAWSVEVRTAKDSNWRKMSEPQATTVSAPAGPPEVAGKNAAKKDGPGSPGIPRHLVYRASLTNLEPGQEFSYRVLREGRDVFSATGHARK